MNLKMPFIWLLTLLAFLSVAPAQDICYGWRCDPIEQVCEWLPGGEYRCEYIQNCYYDEVPCAGPAGRKDAQGRKDSPTASLHKPRAFPTSLSAPGTLAKQIGTGQKKPSACKQVASAETCRMEYDEERGWIYVCEDLPEPDPGTVTLMRRPAPPTPVARYTRPAFTTSLY